MSLPTVAAAARNNAEWCDTVCRVNGCAGRFGGDAWTTARRSPQYYPDAVTLARTATGDGDPAPRRHERGLLGQGQLHGP